MVEIRYKELKSRLANLQIVSGDAGRIVSRISSEFDIEARYSNILVVMGVTFLYSGGMPILYASAGLFFFVTYWVDKCLLLRCYRKPIKFNNYIAT